MTRPTRTLLMLGVISLGGVVVLATIAQRYAKMIGGPRSEGSRPAGTVEAPGEGDAARYVVAYLMIRERLQATRDAQETNAADSKRRSALEQSFAQGLADRGIDRIEYQEIDAVYRAWIEGSAEVPEAYRVELERHREALAATDLAGYDPLGR